MENTNSEQGGLTGAPDMKPFKVAIIGGGPGGLFTAWHLAAKAGLSCQITVFEASGRVGGSSRRSSFPAWDPMKRALRKFTTIPL